MEKIRLGKTGMKVSQLGLGGIPIQRITKGEAVSVVRRCLDLGINFIDTSDNYGRSEEYIGEAISGRAERPFIATKSNYGTPQEVKSNLEQSLNRLRMEYIDLYQFHGVSDFETYEKVISPNGPIATVQEAIESRVVKHIGISSHSMEVAKEAVKSGIFETIMFPFNFVTCEAADELIPLARANDVGFIAMKPLNAGMIENVTIAFKYLRQFPDVLSIPGMEKIKQVEEIIQLYQGPLQMTDVEERETLQLIEELDKRSCRRCGDCDICPEGIRVTMVMQSPGMMKGMPPEKMFSDPFSSDMDKLASCTKCGECEEKCRYGLPVMALIEEYAAHYQEEKAKYLASR